MSLRHVVTAALLFAAAVGWAYASRPEQLNRLPVRTRPLACLLLSVGVLLAGWHGRPERELS